MISLLKFCFSQTDNLNYDICLVPDDWERQDGRASRASYLAISAHLLDTGAGTAPPRWGGKTLMQKQSPQAARRWCESEGTARRRRILLAHLRTPSAGSDSPPPWLSCIRASPAGHLWHHFFHFWPLVQTLGRGPTVGSPWSSFTPPSLGRGRVAPPPPTPPYLLVRVLAFPYWGTGHGGIQKF